MAEEAEPVASTSSAPSPKTTAEPKLDELMERREKMNELKRAIVCIIFNVYYVLQELRHYQ